MLRTDLVPEQRETLEIIKLSADSLMDIINDILDFSRVEAGRLELDPIAFDLRTLVDDAVRTLAPRAHLKDLELICDVASDVPQRVVGDPGRIRQVLLNLLGNALKFTTEGEVEVRATTESTADEQAVVHLSVRDTGIGIPADKQAAIFEAFTQADASTTRRFGGTGLGLTISAHLIGLMGGTITVESEAGKGSTFHARIPVRVLPQTSEFPAPVALADLRGVPVLVVDDNATNRRILDETLRHWGLVPTLVDGGRVALDALERAHAAGRPFAIVLLDFQMPDMDGFEVAAAIKDHSELCGTTIMMLSSVGSRGDGKRCREVGVRAYLTKPVRQSILLDALRFIGGAAPPTAPLITKHSLREAPRSLRVLIAEDNPVNQMVAAKMLEARGHTVAVASTGRAAVELSGREAFDLILMDVQMPEMDGREATAAIRLREGKLGGRLPILAVTASAMEGDREACLAAGMDGYVSKPIRYDSFVEEVERVMAVSVPVGDRMIP
jgi:CheY-like chemotaxis protein